jgi:RHS repeat-associated protein
LEVGRKMQQIRGQYSYVFKITDWVCLQNVTDYSPFGGALDGRTMQGAGYRYGFNGMEKDDEVKGIGNSYDFGARINDPRIGRWISVDPLASKFPMLTPYQFSSNNPVLNVDLDGLEGVSYRVVKKDELTGEVTAIKRVVEVDIHIAVNKKGRGGAYSAESAEQLKILMNSKYNSSGYLDEEGLPVEFKLNFIDFDPKVTKPLDLAGSMQNDRTPTNYTENTIDAEGNDIIAPYGTLTDVVMWQKRISPNGSTSLNRIMINPDRGIYSFGHTESHELTHFLLSVAGFTLQSPDNSIDDHSLGGWMQYGTHTIDENGETIKVEGVDFSFSKAAFDRIILSVPRIEDKEEIIE